MGILSGNDDTIKGLTLLMFTMLGYGVLELLLAWQNISLARAIEEETFPTTFCFVGCFASLLALVTLGLLFAGAYKMYKGSKLQSQEHAKKVKIGVVAIICGFLGSSVLGGVAGFFSSGLIDNGEYTSSMIGLALIGVVIGVLLMGGLLLLVWELAKDKQKKFILLVMGAYILMRIIYGLYLGTVVVGDETETIATLLRYSAIGTGLESLFSFTFAGIYYVVRSNYITKKSWDIDWDSAPRGDEMDAAKKTWQTPKTTSIPPPEQKTPREKLEELRDLKENGLITEEEFKRKKKEILDHY